MTVARTTYEFQLTLGEHDFIGARAIASGHDIEISSDIERKLPTIFLFSSGMGTMTIDQAAFSVRPNTAIIAPMMSVRMHQISHDIAVAGAVIAISDDLLMYYVSKGIARRDLFARPALIELTRDDMEAAQSAALMMIRETIANEPYSTLARLGHFQVLLASLLRHAVAPFEPTKAAETRARHGQEAYLIFRFKGLIEEHYRHRWTLARYAAVLGVSEARLRAASAKVSGVRPMQLIQTRLITEARRLLAYSVMSISEIAIHLGFSEQAHFTRFFKVMHGSGPSMYRQGIAKSVQSGKHQPSDLRLTPTGGRRSKSRLR